MGKETQKTALIVTPVASMVDQFIIPSILKETQYYGYFVLLSNNKMSTFDALREYRLREKTEEGFRIDKQYNDAHITRSKTTTGIL